MKSSLPQWKASAALLLALGAAWGGAFARVVVLRGWAANVGHTPPAAGSSGER